MTKAEEFKSFHGYSLTTAKLMKKHNMTLEEYKKHRAKRKDQEKEVSRTKHKNALAGRKKSKK